MEHATACSLAGLNEGDLCEAKVSLHISFTPGNPLAREILNQAERLSTLMALYDVRQDPTAPPETEAMIEALCKGEDVTL